MCVQVTLQQILSRRTIQHRFKRSFHIASGAKLFLGMVIVVLFEKHLSGFKTVIIESIDTANAFLSWQRE